MDRTVRRAHPAARWALLVVSLLAVPVGAVLTLRPFVSLAVLVVAVVAGLVALGAVHLVADRPAAGDGGTAPTSHAPTRWWWLAGAAHLVAAAVVLLWPGPTIAVLARVVGVALVVDGVLDALAARHGTALQDVAARCALLVDGVLHRDRDEPLGTPSRVDVLPPFAGG